MDIFPIWKSTFYETEADRVKFRIMKWGVQEICRATAVRLPDDELLRIGLNKPCQNYLDSSIDVDATGVTISNAYAEFTLQVWNESNSQWFNAYEFAFVNDWSYSEHEETGSFSEPVNGHAAPGQLIPYTICSSSDTQETICYDEYDFNAHLVVNPTTIVFDETGGTATITIFANANWYLTHYGDLVSVSQTSGTSGTTTISVHCPENLTISELTDTFRIRADKRGTTAIEYVHITQEAVQPYFIITYGENEEINSTGGDWRIGYRTNYPNVYYEFNGQTGYTSGGVLVLNIPPGDTEQTYTCTFYSSDTGTLIGTATARRLQEIGEFFHITFLEPGSVYWGLEYDDLLSDPSGQTIEYTSDTGSTWNTAYCTLENPYEITGNTGDIVYFKATLPGHGTPSEQVYHFYGNTRSNVAGNIMSLEYGSSFAGKKNIQNGKQFYGLFSGFTGLSSAAGLVLPATSVTRYAYASLFQGCTNLVSTPAIAATSLSQGSLSAMFKGCSSLVEAPALPATAMAEYCYANMFEDCVSLTEPPVLNATQLADSCYSQMFRGCTSLVNPPVLPAATLADRCYSGMFSNCSSIVVPPVLASTTLAERCYSSMFANCISIVTAPELPATTLEYGCYSLMFWGCVSLVNAPELPATIAAPYCYESMFKGCVNLVEAPDLPAVLAASWCYANMFEDCVKITDAPDLPATGTTYQNSNYCYSSMFKGCTSLVNAPVIFLPPTREWCFERMFEGCTSLRTAPFIPVSLYKEINNGACRYMFKDCTSLVNPPELFAEQPYGNSCYEGMFQGCTSLVTPPVIHVVNFVSEYGGGHYRNCFKSMFKDCTSLRTAPVLNATDLWDGEYESMFEGCTSLESAPELPETGVSGYTCYRRMFYGCSSLNYVKCLMETDGNDNYATEDWLYGVSTTGTFVKSTNASWATGASGIPDGWTIIDA